MKKKRSVVAIVLAVLLAVGLFAACGGGDQSAAPSQASSVAAGASTGQATGDDGAYTVGLSLPSQALQAWNMIADSFKIVCEEEGLELAITYADESSAKQISDIENLVSQGIDALAILPVDDTALGPVCQLAHEEGVWVMAYEGTIKNTEYLDYFICGADQVNIGWMQGNYFVEHFNLAEDDGKTYTIEIFAGEPSNTSGQQFYEGTMNALQPYLDSGKLVCKSGQVDFLTVAIEQYSMEGAQNRMDNLLTAYYNDGVAPDMVLAPNDSEALGIVNALRNAGYTDPENFPAITGQDCDIANVKLMVEGYIAQNVFRDRHALVVSTVEAIKAHLAGEEPVVHDMTNNGAIDVPTFYGTAVDVRKDNWYKILVEETGVYTLEDLGLTEADIPA